MDRVNALGHVVTAVGEAGGPDTSGRAACADGATAVAQVITTATESDTAAACVGRAERVIRVSSTNSVFVNGDTTHANRRSPNNPGPEYGAPGVDIAHKS